MEIRSRSQFAFFIIFLLLAAALSTEGQAEQQHPIQAPPNLDAAVARVMETFEVPEIGLAIVKDGQQVTSKRFARQAQPKSKL